MLYKRKINQSIVNKNHCIEIADVYMCKTITNANIGTGVLPNILRQYIAFCVLFFSNFFFQLDVYVFYFLHPHVMTTLYVQ